jgi:hypothetical protein
VAEDRLDGLAGRPDVIGQVTATVTLQGKVKGKARRAMTPALVIRLILLMTLLPDSDYPEVIAAVLGDLAAVPWQRPYAPPTATVFSTWREALGPRPLEQLRDLVLAGTDAEHREQDYRAVIVGDLDVCSADGSLTRVPDTPANRHRDRKTKAAPASLPAGGTYPRSPPRPRSASARQPPRSPRRPACRSPPEPLPRPAAPAGPWTRPPPRSDSRTLATPAHRDNSP